MNEQCPSNSRLAVLRARFDERNNPARALSSEWKTAHTEELMRIAESLQRQVDALSTHASKWVTRALELQQRAVPEPPAVRRWDIRPAFGDGVDFLVDPSGEWVKWEDVAPHLRTTQPPEPAPTAWMRGHRSYSPGEPDDYDVECVYGDDPPDDSGQWIPLYRRPSQPPGDVHKQLSDARLNWAMGCSCDCSACKEFDAVVMSLAETKETVLPKAPPCIWRAGCDMPERCAIDGHCCGNGRTSQGERDE